MRTSFGTLWRLILIVALVMAPLFLVYRSKCIEDGEHVDSWSLVAPWDDPPSDCRRHQNGLEVLKDELGL
jgi:hypothetical protein